MLPAVRAAGAGMDKRKLMRFESDPIQPQHRAQLVLQPWSLHWQRFLGLGN